ncbi:unnamed protein product [Clavelina lepadiformis]|uniref:Uncharacterized protein n=1 Tax=Clavelina lepadiformis TaxID=159417 RepID=A0ABP0EUQ6_CLALP
MLQYVSTTAMAGLVLVNILPLVLCLAPSSPRNVTVTPYSRHSILVQWKRPVNLNGKVTSYVIKYGFVKNPAKQISTKKAANNITVTSLESHSIYRFRVAARNSDGIGIYSAWIPTRLDAKTFLLQVHQPSETKAEFQKALYDVLPLAYLSSNEINSTSIDLSTSLVEVFYEISFDANFDLSAEVIEGMFEREQARMLTTYIRNVDVYEINFCTSGTANCHEHASCEDAQGTFRCRCLPGFIDTGVEGHLFQGRQCINNTDEPIELRLNVINITSVRVTFSLPDHVAGEMEGYELEWKTLSADDPDQSEVEFIGKSAFSEDFVVTALTPNAVHSFRVRAVTIIHDLETLGRWTEWKSIRTISNLYKFVFDMNLKNNQTDYQAIKIEAEKNVTKSVKKALSRSSLLSMTDFEVARSDHTAGGLIRFQGILHLKYRTRNRPDLSRLQHVTKLRMKNRFSSDLGIVNATSVRVEDYNECGTKREDCRGNPCDNQEGSFRCKCPLGNVDTSADYRLLPGRKCMVFDAPAAFSVSLNDPKTARLSWKIPAQMRQPQLRFWFLVEHRTRGNMSKQEVKVQINDRDFTQENFIAIARIGGLRTNTDYEFRVAAANAANTGRYTSWRSIKTSNSIFMIHLNLTAVLYTKDFNDEDVAVTKDTADDVRTLIRKLLQPRLPHFMATGKVEFTPGIKDRTFALAHLFFHSKTNVKPLEIRNVFKHNFLPNDALGLDYDAVSVTDFDECHSTWDDCSAHAHCENTSPGFKCSCMNDFVDLSRDKGASPGRICVHKDSITTPQPLTRSTAVSTTPAPTTRPPLPNLEIVAVAVSPTSVKLTWKRTSPPSGGRVETDLNYLFQHRIKAPVPLQWSGNTSAPSYLRELVIAGLRQNFIYQFRVAERWKGESSPHTLYSFPVEIRIRPRSFRIYLRLPQVSPIGVTTHSVEQQRLSEVVSDFISDAFTHDSVKAKFRDLHFGSVGSVTFTADADKGTQASAIMFLTWSSRVTLQSLNEAYATGEGKVGKPWRIVFIAVSDLDDCDSDFLNDCYSATMCGNMFSTFNCTCSSGFQDYSAPYFLLPGRFCQLISPSASSLASSSVTSETNLPPLLITSRPKRTRTTTMTSSRGTPARPVKFVGIFSKSCPNKNQFPNVGHCTDVLRFLGSIEILKKSGTNISQSDVEGEGLGHTKAIVKIALDHVFSSNPAFVATVVQELQVVEGKVRAIIVLIHEHIQPIRFRRETFNLPSLEITSTSLRNGLVGFLDDQLPLGRVTPSGEATVTFSPNDIIIEDIDECTTNLHDCPPMADCLNTEGSFRCRCHPGMTDLASDNQRKGVNCQSQCLPSPCLNGGRCSPTHEVGEPFCDCPEHFHGQFCELSEEQPPDNTLLMVGLAAMAGVLFVFIICFFVTWRINKKNKRRKKMKVEQAEARSDDVSCYSSDFTSDSDDDLNNGHVTRIPKDSTKQDTGCETPPSPILWGPSPEPENSPGDDVDRAPTPIQWGPTAEGESPISDEDPPRPIPRTNPPMRSQDVYSVVNKTRKVTSQSKDNKSLKEKKVLRKPKKLVGGRIRKHSE